MNTKTHCQHIYETKVPAQVNWYQEYARFSLQLMGLTPNLQICLFA